MLIASSYEKRRWEQITEEKNAVSRTLFVCKSELNTLGEAVGVWMERAQAIAESLG